MDILNLIASLNPIVIVIKKHAKPIVLISSVIFVASVLLKDLLEPKLDTEPKGSKNSYWEVSSGKIYLKNKIWRFISNRPLTDQQGVSGTIRIKGAYTLIWNNKTGKTLDVNYHLRFWDANRFNIAHYDPGEGVEFTILPSDSTKKVEGNFEIKVDNLEVAESIKSMRVYASFAERGKK